MLNKLANIIYIPFVVIGIVILGSVAEISYWIHTETGLSFWLSMMLGTAVLFILILAAVSTFKFVRNFTVTAVRSYAHNRQPQPAQPETHDDAPSDTEDNQ